jgi:hypothetical protein
MHACIFFPDFTVEQIRTFTNSAFQVKDVTHTNYTGVVTALETSSETKNSETGTIYYKYCDTVF